MYRWEEMQQYLRTQKPMSFTCDSLAYDLGVSNWEATQLIQAYLSYQRDPYSKAHHILHRTGRTRAAVWHVGHTNGDADELTSQYMNDIRVRLHEAVAPDLNRMKVVNPRIAQLVNSTVNALEANLQVMMTAVGATP